VLDFRVRPHDSKLETSRGKFDKSLATEKGKRQRFFSKSILRNFPYVTKLLVFKQCFVCTEIGLDTAAPETLGSYPFHIWLRHAMLVFMILWCYLP